VIRDVLATVGVSLVMAFSVGSHALAAGSPRVDVSAPLHDAPGALVRVIITVYERPRGYRVALSGSASGGATVTCVGSTWRNPVRASVSRSCYVMLPLVAGPYLLTGIASLTREGAETIVVQGTAARPLRANGFPSPVPMTIAEARRIERCHGVGPAVQLTFDDGATTLGLASILATLRRNGVQGRFFFTRTWAEAHPGLLDLLSIEGHLVGNHTRNHAILTRSTDAEVLKQIDRGIASSMQPPLLRPPFGAGALSDRLVRLASGRSLLLCRWTTDTYDWDGASAAVLIERVRYGDHRSPPVRAGGVILMHGHGAHTAAALQGIIDVIRSRGLLLEPLPKTGEPAG